MSCTHDNIRVFLDVTYYGRLVDGVVYYDSNKVAGVDELRAECMDCAEQFDEIENDDAPGAASSDGELAKKILRNMYQRFEGLADGETDVNGADLIDWLNWCAEDIARAIGGGE